METIQGKTSLELDPAGFKKRLCGFNRILLDLGTGDGRYVRHLAERHPGWFVIGIDPCRENLREHSRARRPNMLFIIAGAQSLPCELGGLASGLSINFPWGSLLDGLLAADGVLVEGLACIASPAASIEVRVNKGALAEAGTTLEAGANRICDNLARAGWLLEAPRPMDAPALRAFPSTWARRLAVGRDRDAMLISGLLPISTRTTE